MIVAVIPTRYEPTRLRRLLAIVAPDADVTLVYDNGHDRLARLPRGVERIDARDMGIYRMWNAGWSRALELTDGGPVDVAILNDDIRILRGTLPMLASALRSEDHLGAVYPDRRTRLRAGLPRGLDMHIEWDPIGPRDLTGYCFLFRGELDLPRFDEGYHWWYGDTQFDESVRLAGYGVGQVNGLPIEHHSDAERDGWARRPELRGLVEADGARWAELHAVIRDGRWVPA